MIVLCTGGGTWCGAVVGKILYYCVGFCYRILDVCPGMSGWETRPNYVHGTIHIHRSFVNLHLDIGLATSSNTLQQYPPVSECIKYHTASISSSTRCALKVEPLVSCISVPAFPSVCLSVCISLRLWCWMARTWVPRCSRRRR